MASHERRCWNGNRRRQIYGHPTASIPSSHPFQSQLCRSNARSMFSSIRPVNNHDNSRQGGSKVHLLAQEPRSLGRRDQRSPAFLLVSSPLAAEQLLFGTNRHRQFDAQSAFVPPGARWLPTTTSRSSVFCELHVSFSLPPTPDFASAAATAQSTPSLRTPDPRDPRDPLRLTRQPQSTPPRTPLVCDDIPFPARHRATP